MTGSIGSGVRRLGLVIGPAAFVAILLSPKPDGLAPEAHAVLAILAWVGTWWLTEPTSLSVVAMLPFVLLPTLGVMSAKDAARGYQEDAIFLFLGGFLLALALERSDVHRRMADAVLRLTGRGPRGVVLGFSVASAATSMWLSNAATTLLLLPAALAVGDEARRRAPEGDVGAKRFAAALALSVAVCSTIGGLCTPVGTMPNMILVKHARDAGLGQDVTFFLWAKTAAPIAAALLVAHFLLLTFVTARYPKTLDLPPPSKTAAPWTREQRLAAVVFGFVVLAWLWRKDAAFGSVVVKGWTTLAAESGLLPAASARMIGDGVVAMFGALVLFLIPPRRGERPLLDWETAEKKVPWGVLLLLGSSFVLADAFELPADGTRGSSLAASLASALDAVRDLSDGARALFLAAGAALVSEVASNTAVAALGVPVGFAAAAAAGRSPLGDGFAVAFGASCSFALPVSTPPNTLVYGTGRVSVALMVGHGLLLDLIAAPLVAWAVS
jgi:solute carrier family 13 (sodium-dependent dicarboxylate transporter), member 2/3/5